MEPYMTEQQLRALTTAYQQAQQRLLVFDHDGVLSPLKTDTSSQASAPSALLLRQLNTIATTPGTQVYVVSGRGKDTLQQWYGKYSAIGLSAEHGAWRNTNGVWQAQIEPFDALKNQVANLLQPFTAAVPGSHIEVKDFAVVWHFRAADQVQAAAAIPQVESALRTAVVGSDLAVYTSATTGKIIEVKPTAINKGAVVTSLLQQYNSPDFVFVIGDDYTDEHAYAACPPGAWTVRVGPGDTAARLRLPNVTAVHALLQQLSDVRV